MDRNVALVVTLAVGALVAFQPPINAMLARHVGDLGAAFVSLSVSTLIIGAALVIAGSVGDLGNIGEIRPVHLVGGVAGAAIVSLTIPTVRALGAGGVAAALICTQLTFSAVLDRQGWFGLEETPLTLTRVLGIGLLIAGTLLVTQQR